VNTQKASKRQEIGVDVHGDVMYAEADTHTYMAVREQGLPDFIHAWSPAAFRKVGSDLMFLALGPSCRSPLHPEVHHWRHSIRRGAARRQVEKLLLRVTRSLDAQGKQGVDQWNTCVGNFRFWLGTSAIAPTCVLIRT
jgi:hypothetical protein